MARIEAKRKEKLSNTIGTYIVIGILSAVVLVGIVLGVIYIVDKLNNDDEGQQFEEQYPNAELITFAELDNLLDNATQSDIEFTDTIYVFVYSPDYETYAKGAELEEQVEAVIAAKTGIFYVVNVEAEENKGYSVESSEFLSQEGLPSNYPYLLVINQSENGIEVAEDGVVTSVREIKNHLATILK